MTRLLCEMLLPSCTKEQREVMELSSLLRTTTLEHVEALCDGESSEGYSWLARQECVHYEPNSICLKDLVRAVIETDMIWTNPVRHSALRSKVESVLRRRVLEDASPESLLDWAYLQRESPFLRHVFGSPRIAEVRIGPAQPADHEAIVDFVRKQGTKKAAALAENFLVDTSVGSVVCQLRGKIVGFTQYLAVEPNRSTKRFDCPAVAVAAEVVEASRSAALVMRPTITAKKRGPEAVGVRLALALHVFQRAMHEDVKLSIFSATSPFAWRDSLPQSILLSTPESVFEIDDCRYELVCGDIGQQSAPSLLGLLGGHSLPAEVEETTDLLDDSTAEKAVRQALKDLHDVTRLNANILAKRPHVLERAGREPSPKRRAEAVRKLLEEAFHEIEANPRSRNHALVLRYTYFEPVGTQEETAGELDLPMTTYRRYLRGAVGAMTTIIQRKLANGD